jgi:hypothetical protein
MIVWGNVWKVLTIVVDKKKEKLADTFSLEGLVGRSKLYFHVEQYCEALKSQKTEAHLRRIKRIISGNKSNILNYREPYMVSKLVSKEMLFVTVESRETINY